jgi:hypothetical protein
MNELIAGIDIGGTKIAVAKAESGILGARAPATQKEQDSNLVLTKGNELARGR